MERWSVEGCFCLMAYASSELILNRRGSDPCSVVTAGPFSRRGDHTHFETRQLSIRFWAGHMPGLSFYNAIIAS